MNCVICGEPVTAKDPERYPYCRNCHYTGLAEERIRREQIARFEELLPGARIAVEHTGGGCFWLAVTFPSEVEYPPHYALTDGEASLPTTDDPAPYTPIANGGWGALGYYEYDAEGEYSNGGDGLGELLFYEEEALHDPAKGKSDEEVAELILAHHAAQN